MNYTNVDPYLPFLTSTTTVWKSTGKSSLFKELLQHGGDKLVGQHIFDFSINLPEIVECEASTQYGLTKFPLPPSFSEPGAPATVFYRVALRVKKGKLSVGDT
jgi:hypothetical protein